MKLGYRIVATADQSYVAYLHSGHTEDEAMTRALEASMAQPVTLIYVDVHEDGAEVGRTYFENGEAGDSYLWD